MSRHEWINEMTADELADFLAGFNLDEVCGLYCRKCRERVDGDCPYGEDDCSHTDAEMVRAWLGEDAGRC